MADPIRTVSQFVRVVEDECGDEPTLFRGQSEDKSLFPRLMRLSCATSVEEAERAMFDEFRRQALPLLQTRPETHWEWLALAQHHGMATRLLDWTLNPLAALWFAVAHPPRPGSSGGVVWFFEVRHDDYARLELDPFVLDHVTVLRPRHVTRRIVAQSGWFTAHPINAEQAEALEANQKFASRLRKLDIPVDAFGDIRRDLDQFNVNAAAMFGDIEGLCRHIEWQYCLLDDERDGC